MLSTAESFFWLFYLLICYEYFGYPIVLSVLKKKSASATTQKDIYPRIILVSVAYNEEKSLRDKMRNSLSLDYPEDRMEIILASDASTDRTNEIVSQFATTDPRVQLVVQPERRGKSATLNHVINNIARGEIIIFSDATTLLARDAVKKLVRNFSDPQVGAVGGKLVFRNAEAASITQGEGLYWRYESLLRKMESDVGALPFVSGAFYGLRRSLYTPVEEGLPDDSVSPLGVYRAGYRVVFDDEAVAFETVAETAEAEFRVKSRGVVRELNAILKFRDLLNPIKFPRISLVIFSHRLLRWGVPFLLIALIIVNAFLLEISLYKVLFSLQGIFYTAAFLGFLGRHKRAQSQWISIPFYYCWVNLAALWGVISFVMGRRISTWQPQR